MRDKLVPIAIALLSLIVSAYVSYNSTDKANAVEITTLKVQRAEDEKRLQRIEAGVIRLDDKIDEILRAVR